MPRSLLSRAATAERTGARSVAPKRPGLHAREQSGIALASVLGDGSSAWSSDGVPRRALRPDSASASLDFQNAR